MEFNDVRFEFISEYTLKSMKLKADKWAKLQGNDEYRQSIIDFFEKPEYNIIVIYQNNAGQLQPTFDFPSSMKAKAVYFSKKEKGMNVGKDNYKTALAYGDLSYSPLEQLSALVDEVTCLQIWRVCALPRKTVKSTTRFVSHRATISFIAGNMLLIKHLNCIVSIFYAVLTH